MKIILVEPMLVPFQFRGPVIKILAEFHKAAKLRIKPKSAGVTFQIAGKRNNGVYQ